MSRQFTVASTLTLRSAVLVSLRWFAFGLALLVTWPQRTLAETHLPNDFTDEIVAGQLNYPIGLAFLPDGRLIVIEQGGTVRLIVEGKLGAIDPMLRVDSVLVTAEQGLTGVTVDPGWPSRPFVYFYYDAIDRTIHITRYMASGDLNAGSSINLMLDLATKYDVMRDIPDRQLTHNGGTVRFGPDGMLYASLGEDQQPCASQDTTSLRGVMLRLDVRNLPFGPGGPPDKALLVPTGNPLASHSNPNARLVWSLGLRNPFRFHIDPADGSLFIADVGWNLFEEIDSATAPLMNFGWPYYEGPAPAASSCPGVTSVSPLQAPIYAYDRTGFSAAVISGGVYRQVGGAAWNFPAEYSGDYFFSDFYEGFLRRLRRVGDQWQIAPVVPGQPTANDWGSGFTSVSDYLEGPDGALWYCKMTDDASRPYTGEIHRITYSNPLASSPDPRQDGVSFSPPYPSPAHGHVRLSYSIPRAARTELSLFDAAGRMARHLVSTGVQNPGRYTVTWDGRLDNGHDAPPSLYIARLTVAGVAHEHRVPLVR